MAEEQFEPCTQFPQAFIRLCERTNTDSSMAKYVTHSCNCVAVSQEQVEDANDL